MVQRCQRAGTALEENKWHYRFFLFKGSFYLVSATHWGTWRGTFGMFVHNCMIAQQSHECTFGTRVIFCRSPGEILRSLHKLFLHRDGVHIIMFECTFYLQFY